MRQDLFTDLLGLWRPFEYGVEWCGGDSDNRGGWGGKWRWSCASTSPWM